MKNPIHYRILASEITDLRSLESALQSAGASYDIQRDSMASAEAREQFRSLCRQHDWHQLPMVFQGGRFIGGEMELRQSLNQQAPLDRLTLSLTVLGLVPFLLGALGSLTQAGSWAASMMPYYGWVILCFMAGTLWGQSTLTPWVRLPAVGFALVAWPGIVLLGPQLTPLVQAILFLGLLPLDRYLMQQGAISAAYWRLRRSITLIVVTCLGTSLIAHSLGAG